MRIGVCPFRIGITPPITAVTSVKRAIRWSIVARFSRGWEEVKGSTPLCIGQTRTLSWVLAMPVLPTMPRVQLPCRPWVNRVNVPPVLMTRRDDSCQCFLINRNVP